MRVWRICKAEHAATAFTGGGAMLYPGRWHHAGTPVVYCSESRALAALEQLVHLHRNRLPPNFVCFGVEIPDDLDIGRVETQELPAAWRRQPAPPELRDIGTRWVESRQTVALRVPSAVVPGEHNFLLNPRHPDFHRLAMWSRTGRGARNARRIRSSSGGLMVEAAGIEPASDHQKHLESFGFSS